MKKALVFCGLAAFLLSSCALFQRSNDLGEADPNQPPFDPAESRSSLSELGESSGTVESEISRLNTKVSALETKLEVLTSNMERIQLQKSQPVIEASQVPQAHPQMNMAAPVEEIPFEEAPSAVQVSAAPARPSPSLPETVKASPASGVEKDFQGAMELFQSGRNLEAASRFALFARRHPRHLLASHSLYWAGEASARAKQWNLALENWEELERVYPRSAYLPDALAGMARANEMMGNTDKALTYRSQLMKAFPKSPVALSLQMAGGESHAPSPSVRDSSPDSEDVPVFSGDDEAVSE